MPMRRQLLTIFCSSSSLEGRLLCMRDYFVVKGFNVWLSNESLLLSHHFFQQVKIKGIGFNASIHKRPTVNKSSIKEDDIAMNSTYSSCEDAPTNRTNDSLLWEDHHVCSVSISLEKRWDCCLQITALSKWLLWITWKRTRKSSFWQMLLRQREACILDLLTLYFLLVVSGSRDSLEAVHDVKPLYNKIQRNNKITDLLLEVCERRHMYWLWQSWWVVLKVDIVELKLRESDLLYTVHVNTLK